MSLITIANFSKPEEAHLLRMRLEAGDVPAYVLDENTIQMDWFLSNAIGGVRVQIEESDMERAQEVLDDKSGDILDAERPICPSCSSARTAPDELPRRISFLFALLAHFPFLYARNVWKCDDCGTTWKERTAHRALTRPQ